MQKLSNIKLIALLSKLLILLLIAKIISLVIWWYLPNDGISLNAKKSYQAKYQRVSFANMLTSSQESVQQTQTQSGSIIAPSIETLVLKGIYGSRFEGFAIIAKKASPEKTTIVAVEEFYEGYRLKEIELNQVILEKDAKEYLLVLKQSQTNISKNTPVETEEDFSQKEVQRGDITNYVKNPALIWQDIGIRELKQNDAIIGFEVTRVKEGSKMASLGLKQNDIITKANNVPLSSLNEVLKLYADIDKIDTLALTIQRNNQEKEIIYEIR